jgi:hypothetical protein
LPTVLEHSLVQLVGAALLVELLFWNFDKVPFTCSYFPGTTSLAVLGVLYVYGITGYSFHMGDLESANGTPLDGRGSLFRRKRRGADMVVAALSGG